MIPEVGMIVSFYHPPAKGLIHGTITLLHMNYAIVESGPDTYTISQDRLILRG